MPVTTTAPSSNSITGPGASSLQSAASLSIIASVAALIFLTSLHFLSPEFDPSWRMVSEYALGNYSAVLSAMFLAWAIGSWALAFAISSQVKTKAGKIGLAFLIAAGLGEAMAAVFNVQHPLHGISAMIGVPSLPVAAMLISVSLNRSPAWRSAGKTLLRTANLTWISLVVMAAAMMLMFSGFARAGVDMTKGAPTELPEGVIALGGWANRLLILVYCVWVITVARHAIRFRGGITADR